MKKAMKYTMPTLAFLSFAVLLGYATMINHYSSAFAQTNNITNQSEQQQQNQSSGGDNPLSQVPVIGQLIGGGENQSQQQGGNQSQNQSQQDSGNPLSDVPVIGELFGGGK
jgi:hypothetical protein